MDEWSESLPSQGLSTLFRVFFPVKSWFCFTSPSDWSRKLMPAFQPIRGNTETNWILVARVFPRLRWFVSIMSCHWLLVTFSFVLIGRYDYESFWFLVSIYNLTLAPAESEPTLMLCNLLEQFLPSDKCDDGGMSFF